jgi:ribosomal protein S18 acetylase RimI-like enzyme
MPQQSPAVTVRQAATPEELSLAADLFREYQAAIGVDLCFQGFEAELAGLPGAYAPPAGRLLLLSVDGEPAGCGAMRPIAPGVAELKRMWVRPAYRGRSLGRTVAEALLEAARAGGYRVARLDTLETMTAARGLYRSLGFREIPAYYENPLPGVVYMERPVG